MRKNFGSILFTIAFFSLTVFSSVYFFASASTGTPSCGTFTYYFSNDGDNGRVEVNYDNDKQVDVTGINGWTVTKVELDVEDDGHSGFWQYATGNVNNLNPNPGGDIDEVRVTVTKSCITASPTLTATPSGGKVYVCKYVGTPGVSETLQTGQNPIEVSVNALPNGWSVGSYFNDQQGRSYVLATVPQNPAPTASNCPKTSTPTPTATSTTRPTNTATPTNVATYQPTFTPTSIPTFTATPFATYEPTATPTEKPCEGECDEPTETPTATTTPIATVFDVCQNIDGIQTSVPDGKHLDAAGINCVEFSPSNPSESSNQTSGGQTVTPQVLGTSTMASTGIVEESIFYTLFSFGSLLTSVGIMKNGKKKAFQIS